MGTVPLDSTEGDTRPMIEVPAEDLLRADTYALLATLLRREPTGDLLETLSAAPPDDSEFGRAIATLAEAACTHTAEEVAEEFHTLFIGIGESELKPYGSFYLTGFMYEKPLARLRAALADLGIAKADETVEPEDHIATLCETMCALIVGEFGAPLPVREQKSFFDAHIAPWAALFFRDLEESPSASFYRPVGTVGRLFLQIETQSFEMTV